MSRQNPQTRLNIAMALAAASIVLLVLTRVPGLTEGLTYIGPAIFVVLLLCLGRYPGEGFLRARIPQRPRRRGAVGDRICRRARVRMPRGAALLACGLAGRAPPVAAHLR